jgi:predicted peptidase
MAPHPVDPQRGYIGGASQGGSGVVGAMARYPGLFAAGVSWAGAWDANEAGALGEARVWALHGAADTVVPPKHSIKTIRAIHQLGGEGRLTILPGIGHGFHTGPEMSEALDWMFGTRRDH